MVNRREFLGSAVAGVVITLTGDIVNVQSAFADTHHSQPIGLWDYSANPVKVTDPALPKDALPEARRAFDSYGGSHHAESVARCWIQKLGSEQANVSCIIDYGSPVALSKFAHYFYTPRIKDYRPDPFLVSSAFSALKIYRSEDGTNWSLAEHLEEISSEWPQIFTLAHPESARYYKFEIAKLVAGATDIRTYEIESFSGPTIHNPSLDRTQTKAGEQCNLKGTVVGTDKPEEFRISLESLKSDIEPIKLSSEIGAAGTFSLALRPIRSGRVPVTLVLRDRTNVVLERRNVVLQVAPRIKVSNVKSQGNTLTGRVLNTAADTLSVTITNGESSVKVPRLAAGQEKEFRIPGAISGGGRQIVELLLNEGSQVSNRWTTSVENVPEAVSGRLQSQVIAAAWATKDNALQLRLTPGVAPMAISTILEISLDGEPISFSASLVRDDKVVFCGQHKQGSLECTLHLTGSAVRAVFRCVTDGIESDKAPGVLTVRMKCEGVIFRFMPVYVYSKVPISTMEGTIWPVCLPHPIQSKQELSTMQGGWILPTRMAALETPSGTVAMIPDRDRCLLGIDQDDAVVSLRLDANAAELLIPAVAGNWFDSFRYVVNEYYKFTEPEQYRPLTDCIIAEAKYLSGNEDIWSKKMQVLTSFPKMDFVFIFYGLTYSIPALYSWYSMSGDEQARERARKSVQWLLEYPDISIKNGPTAGAFFSQYLSPEMKPHPFHQTTTGGCDQAWNKWLEPHATGAVVWILLYVYAAEQKRDRKLLEVAKASIEWLLKIQNPSGGWSYAYNVDGTKVTDEEGSGAIWNVWALYRWGKLTGEKRYLDAAEKGKNWFASKFNRDHICRGYWEDVSGSKGRVALSWEAYDFSLAAIVFAEMGEPELAVEATKNAVTWIWTRVLDCRSYFNSYGHVNEQWGWPPGTYASPMFGLAAQTAYRITGDEFFRHLAGSAKTIGWWNVEETPSGIRPSTASRADIGASFWAKEAMQFTPMEEPLEVSIWSDWITAQQCTTCLRWLVQEVNLRSLGKVVVDPDTLAGTIIGESGRLRLQQGEFNVRGSHGEINWLAYETQNSRVLALINHKIETTLTVDSPAGCSSTATLLVLEDKVWQQEKETGTSIQVVIPAVGSALLIWSKKQIAHSKG